MCRHALLQDQEIQKLKIQNAQSQQSLGISVKIHPLFQPSPSPHLPSTSPAHWHPSGSWSHAAILLTLSEAKQTEAQAALQESAPDNAPAAATVRIQKGRCSVTLHCWDYISARWMLFRIACPAFCVFCHSH